MSDEKPCGRGDVVQMGPDLGDGSRPFVRHTEDHQVQAGVMRPVVEGKPLAGDGDLVQLEASETPGEYRATTMATIKGGQVTEHKGPAKVASPAYRDGWDALFGHKTVGQA